MLQTRISAALSAGIKQHALKHYLASHVYLLAFCWVRMTIPPAVVSNAITVEIIHEV